jgi:dihydropteroate synthase
MKFLCGKYQLNLNRPQVMGIINITPDSFSDGGKFCGVEQAVERALQLVADGADIVDIGGESSRPGATPVGLDEELARVIPVIEALTAVIKVPVSIDTYKPQVMQAAIAAGVDIVNDIRALQELGALEIVANSNVGVCLMHMQGTPQTMQLDPQYGDVVAEVKQFLIDRQQAAMAQGISQQRILLDPGFGFGKRTVHNIALIQHLNSLVDIGTPLLVGLSRKAVLGAISGGDEEQRLHAGLAAAVICVMKGAQVIRVHDVKATVDALKIATAIMPNQTEY